MWTAIGWGDNYDKSLRAISGRTEIMNHLTQSYQSTHSLTAMLPWHEIKSI